MRLLALAILATPTLAAADPHVSLSHPGGMVLVELDDGAGKLAKLVGSSKQNPVRCYKETDGFIGLIGASDRAIIGCYVAVSRDGKLVPPPTSKKWSLAHMMPPFDAQPIVTVQSDGALEFTISGSAGNAIGLWADCDNVSGPMLCRPSNGMLGKFNWNIVFVVGKGGAVRAPKP